MEQPTKAMLTATNLGHLPWSKSVYRSGKRMRATAIQAAMIVAVMIIRILSLFVFNRMFLAL
jgi:hypothetical protein